MPYGSFDCLYTFSTVYEDGRILFYSIVEYSPGYVSKIEVRSVAVIEQDAPDCLAGCCVFVVVYDYAAVQAPAVWPEEFGAEQQIRPLESPFRQLELVVFVYDNSLQLRRVVVALVAIRVPDAPDLLVGCFVCVMPDDAAHVPCRTKFFLY